MSVDEGLLEFCISENETEKVKLFIKYGSGRKAAKESGLSKTTINKIVKRVKDRASLQGYAPEKDMVHTAPDTHFVKGTSTLYKDGEVALQWVKTDKKMEDQYKVMNEVVSAFKEGMPTFKPTSTTGNGVKKLSDLLNAYFITDYHLAMYAWGEENGGDDWDMDIAEKMLIDWFASAIKSSPDSETAIFAQMADFLHYDSMEAVTPSHRNILDADTRFQKVVRVAIRVINKVISMLLEKHDKVHFINASGNHDPASGAWLRELFAYYYKDEPRVTVDTNPDLYYGYEFGNVALFIHHGHKRKPSNVDSVFASKFREMFGRTKFAYAHMGHLHSKDVKESNLMIIEQHQTLAAQDAYASNGGWESQRSAQVITYHKEYGEVARVRITPEMLK